MPIPRRDWTPGRGGDGGASARNHRPLGPRKRRSGDGVEEDRSSRAAVQSTPDQGEAMSLRSGQGEFTHAFDVRAFHWVIFRRLFPLLGPFLALVAAVPDIHAGEP